MVFNVLFALQSINHDQQRIAHQSFLGPEMVKTEGKQVSQQFEQAAVAMTATGPETAGTIAIAIHIDADVMRRPQQGIQALVLGVDNQIPGEKVGGKLVALQNLQEFARLFFPYFNHFIPSLSRMHIFYAKMHNRKDYS